MPHFTYKEPTRDQLGQGDILNKTPDICSILKEVHPHYLKEDYKYFIVLTQTCDLVRRNGKECNARYITIAAVRPFELLVEREIKSFQKNDLERKGKMLDLSNRTKLFMFLERLLNNNEPDYFYLNEDVSLKFPERCVAFLRLSIAIKSAEHYDACLGSKFLELRDDFKAKLGWLVGVIYSRVGTEDWVPKNTTSSSFKKQVNKFLDESCYWLEMKGFLEELKKKLSAEEIKSLSEDRIRNLAREIKIPTRKEKVLSRLEEIFSENPEIFNEANVEKAIKRITNDSALTSYL